MLHSSATQSLPPAPYFSAPAAKQGLRSGLTPRRRRSFILAAIFLFVGVHELAYLRFGQRSLGFGYIWSALAYVPAMILCGRRALRTRGLLRLRWTVWIGSLFLSFSELFLSGLNCYWPAPSAFYTFSPWLAAGSFTLVVLAMVTPSISGTSGLLRGADFIVCGAAILYGVVSFFLTDGFQGESLNWTDYLTSLHLFSAVAALMATRLFYTGPEMKFLNFVVLYQSVDFLGAFIGNDILCLGLNRCGATAADFVLGLAPLALSAALVSRRLAIIKPPRRENYFIQACLPLFLAFTPFLLGLFLVERHRLLGLTGILIGSSGSLFRGTLLQSGVLRSEHGLSRDLSHLRTLTDRDTLTTAANRRAFDQGLASEYRSGHPGSWLSLLVIDLDSFKPLNDAYGHLFGARCLQSVVDVLLQTTEDTPGLVCRFGGDKFAILLPNTLPEPAHALAGSIQSAIEGLTLFSPDTHPVTLSVSIGVASRQLGQLPHATDLIDEADRNLCIAKHNGRDRMVG